MSISLSTRHRRTLQDLFERPTPADVRWDRIEALVWALGGEVSYAGGSRVRFRLLGYSAVFHRPHPGPTAAKGSVEHVRRFLEDAGVRP